MAAIVAVAAGTGVPISADLIVTVEMDGAGRLATVSETAGVSGSIWPVEGAALAQLTKARASEATAAVDVIRRVSGQKAVKV